MALSAARPNGSRLRFHDYSDRMHHLGSTRTLVTLLHPWIRRFTMIISAWCLRTSSKFSVQKFEEIHRNIISRGGVEDTRLEATAKAKDTKKSEAEAKAVFPRTDPLEAKDRNARGQDQEPRTQPQVF